MFEEDKNPDLLESLHEEIFTCEIRVYNRTFEFSGLTISMKEEETDEVRI